MSLGISRGSLPLEKIFRGLIFDLRASFEELLNRGDSLGQGMAD